MVTRERLRALLGKGAESMSDPVRMVVEQLESEKRQLTVELEQAKGRLAKLEHIAELARTFMEPNATLTPKERVGAAIDLARALQELGANNGH